MNSEQLDICLRSDPETRKVYKGVLAFDTLPATAPFTPALYIINTAGVNSAGQHWLAVLFSDRHAAYFFDSYGRALSLQQRPIQTFIQSQVGIYGLASNPAQLQSESTAVCGQYCLFFAYYVCRNITLDKIVHKLESIRPVLLRDKFVYDFVPRAYQVELQKVKFLNCMT